MEMRARLLKGRRSSDVDARSVEVHAGNADRSSNLETNCFQPQVIY